MKPSAFHVPGKHSVTELHFPGLFWPFLKIEGFFFNCFKRIYPLPPPWACFAVVFRTGKEGVFISSQPSGQSTVSSLVSPKVAGSLLETSFIR
jgi:hypothetical protein